MTIVGCTGHQNIPVGATDFIVGGIADSLRHTPSPIIGATSLAAGADQMFADLVLRAGGTLHVVIPCQNYEDTFDDAARNRFESFVDRAETVGTLEFLEPSDGAFLAAGKRVADLCSLLVAIWDGRPAKGLGGTADIVSYALESRREVIVIWPDGVAR